ncbi:MAG TPA: TRAP transporter small permease [Burkholderiaceae bacterium]|nr:TRAP transporter small permease [Burkholderiaceae bacterium]
MSGVVRTYLCLLKGLLVGLAFLMVAMVFTNLVLRYVFASGLSAAEEISRWALVWLGFVGATVALAEKRHIAISALVDALPWPSARLIMVLAQLACLGVSGVFLVGSWRQVTLNMNVAGAVTGWPTGLTLYAAGLFFAAHAVCIIGFQLVELLRADRPCRGQD